MVSIDVGVERIVNGRIEGGKVLPHPPTRLDILILQWGLIDCIARSLCLIVILDILPIWILGASGRVQVHIRLRLIPVRPTLGFTV